MGRGAHPSTGPPMPADLTARAPHIDQGTHLPKGS